MSDRMLARVAKCLAQSEDGGKAPGIAPLCAVREELVGSTVGAQTTILDVLNPHGLQLPLHGGW